jgi:hypothetical protein
MKDRQRQGFSFARAFFLVVLPLAALPSALAAEPFKLGVQEKAYIESAPPMSGYAEYPAYPSAPPRMAPLQGRAGTAAPLQGGVGTTAPPRPPIQATVQKVALPPAFLGVWNVQGQRTKVEAQPEFQEGAQRAFAMTTSTIWEIAGDPTSGYMLASNTGVRTQLVVDKVQGGTAFIRYQHPVGNTMAQEALVLQLQPGGAQFQGLERIAIVKQNQPPRAKVTYQLLGTRQR